ncbi:MAG: ABC transporter ATP-binding protein [Bacteroidetes bacterium]|nr:MAG: ABC transporter ATP-binding protein [Bacteroidota bacterium]TAG88116.1 MAG: ABC transporter ATP-binding protein [Bacteroidota bacterium]
MEKSIYIISKELKDLILQGDNFKAPDLSNFAKEFTIDDFLIDEGLRLEIDFLDQENQENKQKLKKNILTFIDKVVEQHLKEKEELFLFNVKNEQQKKQFLDNKLAKENAAIVFEGKNIGKKYKSNGFYLKNIDLQLRIGEITGVVGENGNGKTTLFRICVGDLQHSEGDIRYPDLQENNWNLIDWHNAKQKIVFIPQELPKWQGNLLDNLRLEAALKGFKGNQNEENVNFILNRMELTAHAHKKWSELSGGYKLRFALAKALVSKPRLLVIDEPLANLDVNAQTIILNDLKDLVESRIFPISVMISSQHLHEIERIAHNLLFLKEGRELYYGKTSEFGSQRLENCFELECELSQQVFEQKLKGFAYNSVRHNGQIMIIQTPLHIREKELLEFLVKNDIKITYFRNISQSIKKYFI